MRRKRWRSSTTNCPSCCIPKTPCKPGAPAVWDEVPNNILVDTNFGDAAATDRAFAQAANVVAMDFNIGRVTGVPLEVRACVANYDAASGRYTLHAGSGGAVRQKNELASILGIKPDSMRVLSFDVGGNFGTRNRVYPEYGLVLWASRKLGRPVKFLATRSECFISDYQGRDLVDETRTGARLQRPLPGAARDQYQQCRRALRVALPAQQGRRINHRQLRHSGRHAARGLGLHQHHPDPGLSQLRPPGSDLRHRTADRHRGGKTRHRPHQPAPPQSGAAEMRCPTATPSA